MEQDKLDKLFKKHQDNFDVHEPEQGHFQRFQHKLGNKSSNRVKTLFNWRPYLAIAASVILLVSISLLMNNPTETKMDLASVSPEMEKTQSFFTLTINEELKKINEEKSPETEVLIDDAMSQIKQLEADYEKLKSDLSESGSDQRVIYAMISNFQSRINILNTVLEQINTIKHLKNNPDENSITL